MYNQSNTDIIALLHEGHRVMPLDKTPENEIKDIVWLLDVVNRGPAVVHKFKKILQSILTVGYEYQKALDTVEKACAENEQRLSVAVFSEFQSHFKKKKTSKSKDGLIASLLKLRSLQMGVGSSMFKMAHDHSTEPTPAPDTEDDTDSKEATSKAEPEQIVIQSDDSDDSYEAQPTELVSKDVALTAEQKTERESKVFEKVMESLTKDENSGLYLLPGKRQLKHLAELRYKVVPKIDKAPKPQNVSDHQSAKDNSQKLSTFLAKRVISNN